MSRPADGIWDFSGVRLTRFVATNTMNKSSPRAIVRPVFTGIALFFTRKNLTALLVALVAALPLLALARAPARPETPQYEALPLERSSQNRLLVRAEINGKPARLLVDTGSPLSVVAVDRAAHFKMYPVSAKSGILSRLNVNGAFN